MISGTGRYLRGPWAIPLREGDADHVWPVGACLQTLDNNFRGTVVTSYPLDFDLILTGQSTPDNIGYTIRLASGGLVSFDYQQLKRCDTGTPTEVATSTGLIATVAADGKSVRCVVTVTAFNSSRPLGQVTLYGDGYAVKTGTLGNGQATFDIALPDAAAHTFWANYAGSAPYLASQSNPVTVGQGGGQSEKPSNLGLILAGAAAFAVVGLVLGSSRRR